MDSYKVFTAEDGRVKNGAQIDEMQLASADVKIDAIIVGEEGRGRRRGIIAVAGAPSDKILHFASIGKSKTNRPKFMAADSATDKTAAIVVFRTSIGYRGSNDHTGDREGWRCRKCDSIFREFAVAKKCPTCGHAVLEKLDFEIYYRPFPGQILVEGVIAQGGAGYAGSGKQIIALVPANVVFMTHYTGRLYGKEPHHFMLFDGEKLVSVTLTERVISEMWL